MWVEEKVIMYWNGKWYIKKGYCVFDVRFFE